MNGQWRLDPEVDDLGRSATRFARCAPAPGEYWRKLDRERLSGRVRRRADPRRLPGGPDPGRYGGSGLIMTAAAAIMEEIHAAGWNGAACRAQM